MRVKFDSDAWYDYEEMVEGKTISTFTATPTGVVIRFTDGSSLNIIKDTMEFKLG